MKYVTDSAMGTALNLLRVLLITILVTSASLVYGAEASGADRAVPIIKVPPRYPDALKAEAITGYVDLQYAVSENGIATDIEVTFSTDKRFNAAAIKALEGWRFKPSVVDGKTVRTDGYQLRLAFEL